MRLLEKTLQELKNGKIEFEDLADGYFVQITEYAENDELTDVDVEYRNIFKLLNNDVCSFKQIVNKFKDIKDIKDHNDDSCLWYLLWSEELFEYLIASNKLTNDDLKYLWNNADELDMSCVLAAGFPLSKQLLDNDIISFQEFIDKIKNPSNTSIVSYLNKLLENDALFEYLIYYEKLTQDDLKYLLNNIINYDEIKSLNDSVYNDNAQLWQYMIDKKAIDRESFIDLLNRSMNVHDSRNQPAFNYLICNKKIFEPIIENNLLDAKDLKYILNQLDDLDKLHHCCSNVSLIKKILNDFIFVLNEEILYKFNTMIEEKHKNHDWLLQKYNIHNLFELIEYKHNNNAEILELSNINKFLVEHLSKLELDLKQKLELSEILRDNKIAQNRLIQIVDNNLESNYDFDSLMDYLKKQERKNLMSI